MAKNAVLPRTHDLPNEHKLQAQFALAAFSTLKAENIAYISVPITSGPRLYDYMDAKGFKTADEAKADHDAFFRNVVEPNLAQGVAGANEWVAKLDGAVIAPAEFEKRLRIQKAISWGQDAFMGMWVPLIDEKVTHMVMLDGWQYSNGSGEEYLQAVLMQMGRRPRSNIEIVDGKGNEISLSQGIKLIADAFVEITGRGMKPRNMAETIAILLEAEHRFAIEQKTGSVAEPPATSPGALSKHTEFNVSPYDRAVIEKCAKEVRDILVRDYPDILPKLQKTSSFDFSPINALFREVAKPIVGAMQFPRPPQKKPPLALVK
ncbi:MAG TPA: hypothetical protein VEF76_14650 [Patescibacteria group bacterium]|nr:hypothetical protein [Patescibacteria group bacterium]